MSRFRKIRYRLIVSHLLPVVVTIPLVLLSIYYAMRMQIVVNEMRESIINESETIRQYTSANPKVWEDPAAAEKMIRELRSDLITGIILFDRNLRFIAGSSAPSSQLPLTLPMPIELLSIEQNREDGFQPQSRYFSPMQNGNIELVIPVLNDNNIPLGMVRLEIPGFYFDNILNGLKFRIIVILATGGILAVLLALFNSRGIEQRLSDTTNAIYDLSTGVRNQPLPVTGPPELSRLSEAFNTLSSQLDESEQSRVKLLSYLTHELGRPLGALASATDALRHGAGKDEKLAGDLINGMKNEIRRLELLVEDLSLLREHSDPSNIFIFKAVPLNDWLNELVTYWSEFAKSKNLVLNAEIEPNLPTVHLDDRRMHQALGNLLNNAIKYSPSGGSIGIRVQQCGDDIEFQISDNGQGIKPEDLPNIFEPFYRGTNKKRYVQGMGLGLTIAHEVVRALNGTISVQSEPGVGTTFTIRLPYKQLNEIPVGEHVVSDGPLRQKRESAEETN